MNAETIQHALEPLPHWARVAFAARCARRVESLFHRAWPEAPSHLLGAVEQAVLHAERCAADASCTGHVARQFAGAAEAAAEEADETSDAVSDSGAYYPAHSAANAAATAIDKNESALGASFAATDAAAALSIIAGEGPDAILADLEQLASLASEHAWTDDTPVPPEVFTPLPGP